MILGSCTRSLACGDSTKCLQSTVFGACWAQSETATPECGAGPERDSFRCATTTPTTVSNRSFDEKVEHVQLRTMDHLARIAMKNAANCVKYGELQGFRNRYMSNAYCGPVIYLPGPRLSEGLLYSNKPVAVLHKNVPLPCIEIHFEPFECLSECVSSRRAACEGRRLVWRIQKSVRFGVRLDAP